MATSTVSRNQLVSGGFLLAQQEREIFVIPEEFSGEQKLIGHEIREFALREIVPKVDGIEKGDLKLVRELLSIACAAGPGSADIPKAFGGSGLDQISSSLIAEHISISGSIGASFTAMGLATLPIVLFGTFEQKQKYLPSLAKGESIAAFALTESSSGSDALNVATSATLSNDGREWVLDGEKIWVTNGGIADIFVIFAKIDHDKFSAFLVEKSFPGLWIGPEHRKISVRGSSACSLTLSQARVPKENLLGTIGQGHAIAFNTLDIGRLRLGASSLGSARNSLYGVIPHIKQRCAFGKPIANFGCTKEKIANMAAGIYAGESMLYRTAGVLERALSEVGNSVGESTARAIEECAAECCIVKIWGSECLNYVVDEALQIFGSIGFTEEHPVGRAYCDARINRICEGTNEINRLIVAVWIMKRAINGKLRIGDRMRRIRDEVLTGPNPAEPLEGAMAVERKLVENMRTAALMIVGMAWQQYEMAVVDQQEIVTAFADMLIEYYAADSAVRRARRLIDLRGEPAAGMACAMSQVTLVHSLHKSGVAARKAIATLSNTALVDKYSSMLCYLFQHRPFNTIALCQQIGNYLIEGNDQLI